MFEIFSIFDSFSNARRFQDERTSAPNAGKYSIFGNMLAFTFTSPVCIEIPQDYICKITSRPTDTLVYTSMQIENHLVSQHGAMSSVDIWANENRVRSIRRRRFIRRLDESENACVHILSIFKWIILKKSILGNEWTSLKLKDKFTVAPRDRCSRLRNRRRARHERRVVVRWLDHTCRNFAFICWLI